MESTIDKYISRLLFDHECVVVPGFGAFLTRYYPAEINNATHMMRPPSRRVSFNSRIKENDGLLAKYISVYENRPYNEALSSIAISVRGWKRILKTGKKVNLTGIGRLYMDKEEKIQFNPAIDVNYDKNSFGLNIFRSPAVQRELEIKKSVQRAIDIHIPARTQKEREKRALPFLRWAAVLAPFLALGVAAGVYLNNSPLSFQNIAGLNPFSYQASSEETPEPANETIEAPELTESHIPLTEEGTSETAIEDMSVKPAEQVELPQAVQGSYHIVVGSFKEKDNAQSYVTNLRSQGFDAYLAQGDQRFHRVAVGNFTSHHLASQELSIIKNQVNSGAWVYSN
ncbi:MAG: SPOR domain-containing protein [Owenweeksia sp.]